MEPREQPTYSRSARHGLRNRPAVASRVARALVAVLALSLLTSAAFVARADQPLNLSLPDMGEPADQVMTSAQEAQLGQRIMAQLRQQLPLVDDPVVNAYIDDLGRRLAGHTGRGDFEFFVVDNPTINAFALPGGYIGVHEGLIEAADNESQLASVIAHEIAHVTQRHIARRKLASQGQGLRTLAMVLAGVLLSTQDPEAGSAAMMGGMAATVQNQLNFSRENEREADNVGIETLASAGFDPQGMPAFFQKLRQANRYRGQPPPFLSTHPLTGERIAEARARAQEVTSDEVFESPAFPYIHSRVIARRSEDANDSVDLFNKRLANGDDDPATRYGLAVAQIRAGDPEAAVPELQALRHEQRDYALFYTTLAEARLAMNEPAQAVETIDEGLSLYPDDYALRYRRIEALIRADRGREALQTASATSRDYPDDVPLMQLRARAADASGDQAEARLATAEYYASRGDLRGGLRQITQLLEGARADPYQRSRAEALRSRWRTEIERQQSDS